MDGLMEGRTDKQNIWQHNKFFLLFFLLSKLKYSTWGHIDWGCGSCRRGWLAGWSGTWRGLWLCSKYTGGLQFGWMEVALALVKVYWRSLCLVELRLWVLSPIFYSLRSRRSFERNNITSLKILSSIHYNNKHIGFNHYMLILFTLSLVISRY